MTKPKPKTSWEKEFDQRFNKEVVVFGDYLFQDLKSFISQELKREREEILGEVEQIVRANHMRANVGYGLGMRKLILLKDLFDILSDLKEREGK